MPVAGGGGGGGGYFFTYAVAYMHSPASSGLVQWMVAAGEPGATAQRARRNGIAWLVQILLMRAGEWRARDGLCVTWITSNDSDNSNLI